MNKSTFMGKKLYAKIDQIAFEQVVRESHYSINAYLIEVDTSWRTEKVKENILHSALKKAKICYNGSSIIMRIMEIIRLC